MIYLNTTQEIHVIRYLKHKPSLYLDNGASRAVFECTTDICDYLKLPLSDADDYIIKVALGKGGMQQMNTEIAAWHKHPDKNIFAEIVACGRYIEIMENVETWDFTEAADWGDECCEEDVLRCCDEGVINEDDAEKITHTILTLTDIFGNTSDNGQLGHTGDDRWVAYDYGFMCGVDRDTQVSPIHDYIYGDEERTAYLEGLINLLKDEYTYMEEWEETFLQNIE